ncbi:UNVERIFIED_CONTAM: hypothetical protein FKN15_067594 [Acipenser sinensis]
MQFLSSQPWRLPKCYNLLSQSGPEKGVVQLATAAVLNAIWDLLAKSVGKVAMSFFCDISVTRYCRYRCNAKLIVIRSSHFCQL